jgi:hypothetical protein
MPAARSKNTSTSSTGSPQEWKPEVIAQTGIFVRLPAGFRPVRIIGEDTDPKPATIEEE